jgi:hypothetical protein
MNLKKSLKIFKDVVDVMAQIKRSVKDTTHLDASFKKFKKMVKAPKKINKLKVEV